MCTQHFYGAQRDVTFRKCCVLRTSVKWKAGMSSFVLQLLNKPERIFIHRWCFISCRYLDFTMKEVRPNFIRNSAEER